MNELKDISFFSRLNDLFEENGFEYMPKQNQFKKLTPSGFHNIILHPTHHEETVYFDLHFGTRINLVEQTIRPYTHNLRGFKDDSNTCVTSIGKYLGRSYYRLHATGSRELRATGNYIHDFFEREGLKFLYSLRDLAKVEHAFNAAPHKESFLAYNHEFRCFRGITLAALTQNHSFERVNEAYLDYFKLRKSPQMIIENYKRLVSFLTNTGLN